MVISTTVLQPGEARRLDMTFKVRVQALEFSGDMDQVYLLDVRGSGLPDGVEPDGLSLPCLPERRLNLGNWGGDLSLLLENRADTPQTVSITPKFIS